MQEDNGDHFYKKVGKRYVKLGTFSPFTPWFPDDGVWLVQRKDHGLSQSCIMKIGDIPELYPYAKMAVDIDDLGIEINRINQSNKGAVSAYDLSKAILMFLSKKDTESKKNKTSKNRKGE